MYMSLSKETENQSRMTKGILHTSKVLDVSNQNLQLVTFNKLSKQWSRSKEGSSLKNNWMPAINVLNSVIHTYIYLVL